MKRFIVLIAILVITFLGVPSFCGTKDITFAWDQDNIGLVASWNLLYAYTKGGPYTQLVNIPYGGTPQDSYRYRLSFDLVPDGEWKWVYFVVNAVVTDETISGVSNEVRVLIDFTVHEGGGGGGMFIP